MGNTDKSRADLFEEATCTLARAHLLHQRKRDKKLVERITVAQGYLQLFTACPGDIDYERKLRAALAQLQAVLTEYAA